MGFLSSLFGGDAGKATISAAKDNKQAYSDYRDISKGIINTGETQSLGALNSGISAFSPYAQTGQSANTMYSNALGLNGADGNAAATGAFQAGPGYDFALKQGEQSALRGASAAGMLNSGNTLTALNEYGQGLANKEYGGWLDRLAGQSAQGLQAATGQANGYGNISNLYQNTTGQRLGVESDYTSGITGANNQVAQGKEANASAKSGMFGSLLSAGTKLLTGGLF